MITHVKIPDTRLIIIQILAVRFFASDCNNRLCLRLSFSVSIALLYSELELDELTIAIIPPIRQQKIVQIMDIAIILHIPAHGRPVNPA
mgnify:CR=1 FL=1